MVFDPINWNTIDAAERAIERFLQQFYNSPVMIDIMIALTSEIQALMGTTKEVIEERAPADAIGEQQNALGRIVGQSRYLGLTYDDSWFTPDSSLLGADEGKAWVTGAEYESNSESDDAAYSLLIEGKIARNFTKYGSVPEIQEAIKIAFDVDVSFVLESPMAVTVIVPDDTPLWIIQLFQNRTDTTRVDSVYYMPVPATVLISNVVRLSDYTP